MAIKTQSGVSCDFNAEERTMQFAIIVYTATWGVRDVSDLYSTPDSYIADCDLPLSASASIWATPGTYEEDERRRAAWEKYNAAI